MVFTVIISIILGIVVPILLPLIPNIALSLGEQIEIGLLTTTIPLLLDIAKSLNTLRKKEEMSQITLKARNDFDSELLKISSYFASFGDIRQRGIFSSYFQKEISQITDTMLDASEKHRFRGRVQHVVDNNYILSCFGRSPRKWKLTWILENENNPVISSDDAWNSYFSQATKLLEKNSIIEINILFIADDQVFEAIKRKNSCGVKNYVKGFTKKKKPVFKIIRKNQYDENFRNAFSRESQINRDIGIYGTNLLFIYDNQDQNYGIYNENDTDITLYNTFFDNVWAVSDDIG